MARKRAPAGSQGRLHPCLPACPSRLPAVRLPCPLAVDTVGRSCDVLLGQPGLCLAWARGCCTHRWLSVRADVGAGGRETSPERKGRAFL